jgi:ribose 1,5-bisphosphokinase PhnN
LVIFGPTGSGKTAITAIMDRAPCQEQKIQNFSHRCRFRSGLILCAGDKSPQSCSWYSAANDWG